MWGKRAKTTNIPAARRISSFFQPCRGPRGLSSHLVEAKPTSQRLKGASQQPSLLAARSFLQGSHSTRGSAPRNSRRDKRFFKTCRLSGDLEDTLHPSLRNYGGIVNSGFGLLLRRQPIPLVKPRRSQVQFLDGHSLYSMAVQNTARLPRALQKANTATSETND